jgi:hypothetical protein
MSKRWRPWLVAFGLVFGSTLAAAAPAPAEADLCGFARGSTEFGGATIDGGVGLHGTARCVGHAGSVGSAPRLVVLYLPACEGNDPNSPTSKDATCSRALSMCWRTAIPDDVMFWRFEAPGGPPRGRWVQVGSVCLRPTQAPSGAVPAFTVRELQRLPLPAGTVHVQPPGGRTLVNVPTNVFVSAGPVTLATRLLGLAVRVRATPVSYRWTFGDGAVLETSDPGHPYPAMTTTHTYLAAAARVGVRLQTTYSGEYSVAGGPWLPIDGLAFVGSPPVALQVLETHAVLVADPIHP